MISLLSITFQNHLFFFFNWWKIKHCQSESTLPSKSKFGITQSLMTHSSVNHLRTIFMEKHSLNIIINISFCVPRGKMGLSTWWWVFVYLQGCDFGSPFLPLNKKRKNVITISQLWRFFQNCVKNNCNLKVSIAWFSCKCKKKLKIE